MFQKEETSFMANSSQPTGEKERECLCLRKRQGDSCVCVCDLLHDEQQPIHRRQRDSDCVYVCVRE